MRSGESKKISEEELLGQLKEKLLAADYFGSVAGILHTYNDSLADVVQSDRTDVLYGRDYITEKILGLEFKTQHFLSSRQIRSEQKFCTVRRENMSGKQKTK